MCMSDGVFVFLSLLHFEHQNAHSTSKVGTSLAGQPQRTVGFRVEDKIGFRS